MRMNKRRRSVSKPSEDEIGLVGLPLSFDGQRPPPLPSAPALGQDNDSLQQVLGR